MTIENKIKNKVSKVLSNYIDSLLKINNFKFDIKVSQILKIYNIEFNINGKIILSQYDEVNKTFKIVSIREVYDIDSNNYEEILSLLKIESVIIDNIPRLEVEINNIFKELEVSKNE